MGSMSQPAPKPWPLRMSRLRPAESVESNRDGAVELVGPAHPHGLRTSRPTRRRRWLELRAELPAPVYRALAVAGFALSLLAWVLVSRAEVIDSVFLPSPGAVWEAA